MSSYTRGVTVSAAVVVLGSALTAASATKTKGQTPRPTNRALISALNECIQERFADVDETYGFRRLVRIGDTPHRFRPENARELSAVRDLERARLQVSLYLAGRTVLGPRPETVKPLPVALQPIKGPVLIAPAVVGPGSGAEKAPASMDLWDQSRRAMIAFTRTESDEFSIDGWNISARPVRATDRTCLKCHSADGTTSMWSRPEPDARLRLGDPLGVVLYAVRPAR